MKFAVIAHDNKKADMVSFVMKRLSFFKKDEVELVATGTTGNLIEDAGLRVQRVASGPYGGDAEIAAMVTRGEIDGVVFLRDPLGKHPHDVDVSMLLRLCDVHNVPLATNFETGSIVVEHLNKKA